MYSGTVVKTHLLQVALLYTEVDIVARNQAREHSASCLGSVALKQLQKRLEGCQCRIDKWQRIVTLAKTRRGFGARRVDIGKLRLQAKVTAVFSEVIIGNFRSVCLLLVVAVIVVVLVVATFIVVVVVLVFIFVASRLSAATQGRCFAPESALPQVGFEFACVDKVRCETTQSIMPRYTTRSERKQEVPSQG